MRSRLLRRACALVPLALALAAPALAQQPTDRSTTEAMRRLGPGDDIATVSPLSGHAEVSVPLVTLPGRGGSAWSYGLRYSGARRWWSQYNEYSSGGTEWIVQAGDLEAINMIGRTGVVATRNAPRPWRTMPLYYLRVVPTSEAYFLGGSWGSDGYAKYAIRYVLQTPDGTQHELRHFADGGAETTRCLADVHASLGRDRWRAIDGSHIELDHSSPNEVVVVLPGGARLTFPWETEASLFDGCSRTTITNLRKFRYFESAATRLVDRNGNEVRFDDAFDAAAGTGVVTVTGPTGASARFHYVAHTATRFDEHGPAEPTRRFDVERIDFEGPGGRTISHRLVWGERAFDELALLNPSIPGAGETLAFRDRTMSQSFFVLERVELADGGRYAFGWHDTTRDGDAAPRTYEGLVVSDGRLVSVELPTGGAVRYAYNGDPCRDPARRGTANWSYYCDRRAEFVTGVRQTRAAPGCWPTIDGSTPVGACLDPWAANGEPYAAMDAQRLDWLRVSARHVYDGISPEPVATTTYAARVEWGVGPCQPDYPYGAGHCGLFVLEATTGSRSVTSRYFTAGSMMAGQLADVVERDAGVEVRRTTFGFLLGEGAYDWEETSDFRGSMWTNVRSLRSEVREGEQVVTTETVYDQSAGRTCVRRALGAGLTPACYPHEHTRGNVLERTVRANGRALRRERYRYTGSVAHVRAGLWGLVVEATVDDGEQTAARSETFYDEGELVEASGAGQLAEVGPARGNVTRVRTWLDATRFAEETLTYYRTGDVAVRRDARGNATTFTADFRPCDGDGLRVQAIRNPRGQTRETATDCYTGLARRETDENGATTWTVYDDAGRPVRSWGPGDSEASPTRWTEFFTFGTTGAVAAQRIVDHVKDGTPDGLVTKTFFDGLGRIVQTRNELDPTTTEGGHAESVVTMIYDAFGQPLRAYEACGASASDVVTPPCSPLFTASAHDALGRVVLLDPPGPAITRTSFTGTAEGLVMRVVDARGGVSETLADGLGRPIRVRSQWDDPAADAKGCPGGWCTSQTTWDAAGRRTSIADARGNRVVMRWDWGGRLSMQEDPDLGTWTFVYDDDGNLLVRQDARGQRIRYEHDALGRLVLEDREPVNVPGAEDLRYFYDGEQPASCYSCDDHDATTTDRCTPDLVCEHARADGTTTDPPPSAPPSDPPSTDPGGGGSGGGGGEGGGGGSPTPSPDPAPTPDPTPACDATTRCDATYTRADGEVSYCRSMNDGPYAWISTAEAAVYCDQPEDECVSTTRCEGYLFTCGRPAPEADRTWLFGTCG